MTPRSGPRWASAAGISLHSARQPPHPPPYAHYVLFVYFVGPERKGPYVTFCQIEKIGFKVQNSRKNKFLYKKLYFYAYL